MNPLDRAARLWRTVRWLRREQVLGRARLLLRRQLNFARADLRPAPPLRAPAHSVSASASQAWLRPPPREASLVDPTRFRLLAVEHDLPDIGWDDPALPLLWRYHQHYFDDLNAAGADARRDWHRALLEHWLAANPPAAGTGWAPYPTSLRIVNWIKWFMAGQSSPSHWLDSLAAQARWLAAHIEWHLLGNHLFVNAKALVFAGLFFDGPEADGWWRQGLAILERELPEQILPDGGQFERSPVYHLLALEDMLDLLNLLRVHSSGPSRAALAVSTPGVPVAAVAALAERLQGLAGPMLQWLRHLRHPGGALVRFNDGAEGVAPPVQEIERYAAALGITAGSPPGPGVVHLQPSGYVRAERGGAVVFIDLAPIGPDYLPGHAHADTLSFECSWRGRELVVNRGTSVYGEGLRRQLERGTAAHSTVQIGDQDSSEVWAGFRVGRRARVREESIRGFEVAGAHDGYAHLPSRPLHLRRWLLDEAALTVEDRIECTGVRLAHPATARFHLAPGLELSQAGDGRWCVHEGPRVWVEVRVDIGRASVEHWQHACRFGELQPALTLAVALVDGRSTVHWIWTP